MNHNRVPSSLKLSAIVAISVELWKHADLQTDLVRRQPTFSKRRAIWERTFVAKIIPRLTRLPEALRDELGSFVERVTILQACKWLEWEGPILDGCRKLANGGLGQLCWTRLGEVDKEGTARAFVANPSVTVRERFILACAYCLDDEIRLLWPQYRLLWPQQVSAKEEDESSLPDDVPWWFEKPLTFWIGVLSKELTVTDLGDLCQTFFYTVAALGFNQSLAATKYFFRQMTPAARVMGLTGGGLANFVNREFDRDPYEKAADNSKTIVYKENYLDVLCFLLSQIVDEDDDDANHQQLELSSLFRHNNKRHRHNVKNILLSLLHYRRLDWFASITTATRGKFLFDLLSNDEYLDVLVSVAVTEQETAQMIEYESFRGSLVDQFWTGSSSSSVVHRKYVTADDEGLAKLLLALCERRAFGYVTFFVEQASPATRTKMMMSSSCGGGKELCLRLLDCGRWDVAETVLAQCLSCRYDVHKLKCQFDEYFRSKGISSKVLTGSLDNKFDQLIEKYSLS